VKTQIWNKCLIDNLVCAADLRASIWSDIIFCQNWLRFAGSAFFLFGEPRFFFVTLLESKGFHQQFCLWNSPLFFSKNQFSCFIWCMQRYHWFHQKSCPVVSMLNNSAGEVSFVCENYWQLVAIFRFDSVAKLSHMLCICGYSALCTHLSSRKGRWHRWSYGN